MKKIVVAACLLLFCRNAEADVIIGNSVGGPYLTGSNIGKKALAFLTGSSVLRLENIQVALGGLSSGGDGDVVFTLNADASGLPGALIAAIGTGKAPAGFLPSQPYTITPAAPLVLNPNTTYWIQAEFVRHPTSGGVTQWDQPNPAVAPSSPAGLASFIKYMFDNGTGWANSSTYNAIVVNGLVNDRSRGTAARAILEGSRCGFVITPQDSLHGDYGVDSFSSVDWDHVGWSSAGGIQRSAPRVGAFLTSNNLVAALTSTPLGVGTAGSRAIAFRKYKNDTANTIAVPASAILDGEFVTGPTLSFRSGLCGAIDANSTGGNGHATAAVYVFDAAYFDNALTSSGGTMPQFLLGSDTLDDYRAGTGARLKLTNLASLSAPLAEDFQQFDQASFVTGTTVGPISVSVAPGQSIIVVFDITAYSPPGAEVRLIDTLKPGLGFMNGLTLVGPTIPDPPAAANLALAPAATTQPIATPVTVTATATTTGGAPVPNTIVVFNMSAGPNAQPLGPALTDANGQVSFTYSGGAIAGLDVIQARIGSLQSNAAHITWTTPGPLDHITVTPASATIAAGASQSYTAQALDVFEHVIGDVTANTAFTISPNGSCTGAACTASIAGTHTVTGAYNGKTATATLNVTSSGYVFQGFFQPIDMSTLTVIVWNTVKAGLAVPIKWRLTQDGLPVSNPASFLGLVSSSIACSSGAGSIDAPIEQIADGNSALRYKGDGNWQVTWKTPAPGSTAAPDKATCLAVAARFNDGSTSSPAYFKLK